MMRRAHGSTSHAQQEKLRAENRRREEFIEDNNRMLKTEAMINANILAEEKVENKILIRRLQREAQEVEMDKALEEVCLLLYHFQCYDLLQLHAMKVHWNCIRCFSIIKASRKLVVFLIYQLSDRARKQKKRGSSSCSRKKSWHVRWRCCARKRCRTRS